MKRLFQISLLALTLATQTGCLLTYLVANGTEQFKIMNKREPIEKALNSPNVKEETKKKLRLALKVREFAEKDLSFKPTQNYKTYVDLKRPYVTWVLIVSPKNDVKAHQWKYPIIGALPYRGFFSKEETVEEEKKWDKAKYDTFIRGVSAYSTLGWFDDPLLSSMINGEDSDLVNLIIHESAHATLFIKSQADFNERLATFLGNKGTEVFYSKNEGQDSPTLKKIKAEDVDEKMFSAFVTDEIKSLKVWYKAHPDLVGRAERIKEITERFKTVVRPKMKTDRFARFEKVELNNAYLASLNTYVYDLSDFDKLYDQVKGDFSVFLKICKSLENEKYPSQKLKELLLPTN